MIDPEDVIEIAPEFVSDLGPVRTIKHIWDKLTEYRIKSLICGCAKELDGSSTLSEKSRAKLRVYVSSGFGIETLDGFRKKVLHANSQWACRIMGVILGRAISQSRTLELRERILVEALEWLSDCELKFLLHIFASYPMLPVPPEAKIEADKIGIDLETHLSQCCITVEDYHNTRLLEGDMDEHRHIVRRLKTAGILSSPHLHRNQNTFDPTGGFAFTNLSNELISFAKMVM